MSGTTDLTARKGVEAVRSLLVDLGWYPREPSDPDQGIDLLVETAVDGIVDGRMLAMQIKSGTSQVSEQNSAHAVHRCTDRHVKYWLGHSLPVLVVLYDPNEKLAYWQVVSGPVPRLSRGERQEELVATALYPHAVHVVGEGKSEREFITTLVAAIIGERAAQEIGFTDLGGSGSASRLTTMVEGFTTYAERTVLIVDSEGEMERYVVGLERSGKLASEDILRFTRNIEDDSFDATEQIDVLTQFAANPQDGRPAVQLTITEEQLEQAYSERRIRARQDPGRAGVLLGLAEDPTKGGPVCLGKPEFACVLAERMLDEMAAAQGDQQATDALYERRRLVKFTLERIVPPLMSPRW